MEAPYILVELSSSEGSMGKDPTTLKCLTDEALFISMCNYRKTVPK
jgi:hypothetical protein